MKTLVLASDNRGKLAEFRALLSDWGYSIRPQGEFNVTSAPETGLTFIENAILKARHACAQTGFPALADDSGIAVDALGGRPGIYSARFAGSGASDAANNEKLLCELAGVAEENRTARYHCVLVLLQHAADPTPLICHAEWSGRILSAPAGSGGFGYDPLFFVRSHNCTAAQMDPTEKNRISHRGQALQQIAAALRRRHPVQP